MSFYPLIIEQGLLRQASAEDNICIGALSVSQIALGDNEPIYFGDDNDASFFYNEANLIIEVDRLIGEVQITGKLRCEAFRIGDDIAGYEAYGFTVCDGYGGMIFRRVHATSEPFLFMTNSTAGSGGQMRGLLTGGLKFTNDVGTDYGVEINGNCLDLNSNKNNNHLLLRGGDTAAGATGDQIRFTWDSTVLLAHGIMTRHNNASGAGNALDFYLWRHGVDSTSVNMGTLRAFIIESDGIKIPQDDYSLRLGVDGNASILYNGTNLVINPKVVGAGILDVAGTLQTDGYNSSDGTAGATADADVAKVGGGTRTLHFKDGLYTGYTDS